MTQLLYHGGDAEALPRIRKEGLLRRRKSKAVSNWKHTVPSNPKAVYLTTTYPFHFAGMFNKGFIAEVPRENLDEKKLYPDEDAIEQASRKAPADWPYAPPAHVTSMEARTRWFRDRYRDFDHLTEASLDIMGTAAYYGDIPASSLGRIHVIDWSKVPFPLRIMAQDTTVSAITYKLRGPVYQALTRWLTGHSIEVSEIDDFAHHVLKAELPDDPQFAAMRATALKRKATWEEALADTSGLSTLEAA